MAQHSHVPKFGNWDTDNVPYTACFEHARKEKAGMMMMMNPNDPMENPEAFNTWTRVGENDEVMGTHHNGSSLEKGSHTHRHVRHRSRGSHGSVKSSSSSSHNGHKSKSSSFSDHTHHRVTAIPKFGTWDVTNPQSGEGYTAIFTKIKEEKQITSMQFPSINNTPPLNNFSNIKNQNGAPSSSLSKYCCCLFPGERK